MKIIAILISIINICAVTAVMAVPITPSQMEIIDTALKKVNPTVDIKTANIELINHDLYKIVSGAEVFYVSKDGGYFFYGDLIDLKQADHSIWNLTDTTKRNIRKTELSKFSKKEMLIFRSKTHKHRKSIGTITVFADVSCPHSNRLFKEVETAVAAGVEARYVFFPRGGIGSDSYNKAVSIWCAKNRKTAFSMANNNEEIQEKTCKKNPIEHQFNMSLKLGIHATPTIVLENGAMIPGFITSDNLLRIVKEAHAHSSS